MNLIFRERDMDYFWFEDYPEAIDNFGKVELYSEAE